MSENLKGLLEKINQEGIKSAEEKARVIEDKAGKNAEKIVTGLLLQHQYIKKKLPIKSISFHIAS
jgi:hypothetical protein